MTQKICESFGGFGKVNRNNFTEEREFGEIVVKSIEQVHAKGVAERIREIPSSHKALCWQN